MMLHLTTVVVVTAALGALPAYAAGQTAPRVPAQTLSELATVAGPGERVTITLQDGTRFSGRIQSVTGPVLLVRRRGDVREVPGTDVLEVRRKGDRLWNGALIGASAGAIGGAFWGKSRPGCDGHDAGFCAGIGALLGIGTGALTGLLTDAVMPHADVLYSRSRARDGLDDTLAGAAAGWGPPRGVVQSEDSTANGAAVGALIGAGAALGLTALMYANCDHGCEAPAEGPTYLLAGGVGAGGGALVGWLVDKARRPRANVSRAVTVAPIVANARKGVVVSYVF